jgi:hypothetical protein
MELRDLKSPLLDGRHSMASSAQSPMLSQGKIFSGGLAVFGFAYIFMILTGAVYTDGDSTGNGICMVMYAVLQTGGLIFMTTADVDANLYMRRNKAGLKLFLCSSSASFSP